MKCQKAIKFKKKNQNFQKYRKIRKLSKDFNFFLKKVVVSYKFLTFNFTTFPNKILQFPNPKTLKFQLHSTFFHSLKGQKITKNPPNKKKSILLMQNIKKKSPQLTREEKKAQKIARKHAER